MRSTCWRWSSANIVGIATTSISLVCHSCSTGFTIGMAIRFDLHSNPDSRGVFIAEQLFVVLSPCAFIAGEYILLAHLSSYLRSPKFLLISPLAIAKTFIWSDITTFLIQAAGASISISHDISTAKLGYHVSHRHKIIVVPLV